MSKTSAQHHHSGLTLKELQQLILLHVAAFTKRRHFLEEVAFGVSNWPKASTVVVQTDEHLTAVVRLGLLSRVLTKQTECTHVIAPILLNSLQFFEANIDWFLAFCSRFEELTECVSVLKSLRKTVRIHAVISAGFWRKGPNPSHEECVEKVFGSRLRGDLRLPSVFSETTAVRRLQQSEADLDTVELIQSLAAMPKSQASATRLTATYSWLDFKRQFDAVLFEGICPFLTDALQQSAANESVAVSAMSAVPLTVSRIAVELISGKLAMHSFADKWPVFVVKGALVRIKQKKQWNVAKVIHVSADTLCVSPIGGSGLIRIGDCALVNPITSETMQSATHRVAKSRRTVNRILDGVHRGRRQWTEDEDAALRAAIAHYGTGHWARIKKDPKWRFALINRNKGMLKDRYRFWVKKGTI